jgi:hypothetical protein
MQNKVASALGIPDRSNLLHNGRNNMANNPAKHKGTRNGLAKYSPVKTRKRKKRTNTAL